MGLSQFWEKLGGRLSLSLLNPWQFREFTFFGFLLDLFLGWLEPFFGSHVQRSTALTSFEPRVKSCQENLAPSFLAQILGLFPTGATTF